MGDARWDAVAHDFIGHYTNLYGQVRIHVLHAHLLDHLPPPPAEIVDIGGGAGNQSIGLARAGFNLTIVDPSSVMLAEADRLLATEPPAVGARVRLVEADGEQALELLGEGQFDGVLCHGVLMYLDDPAPLVSAVCGLVRPNGIVSIVTKNRRTLAAGPAYQGDWRVALRSFDGERQVNGLGIDTRADDPDDLTERLRDRGIELIAWYGVRTFTEGWARDRPPVDPVDDVLAVELEASRRDPYRQMSRLFHLVGRRDPGAPT
jgi:S-adenosylmethionine-dependent methyltransferase